jgi:hypothetical protein
MPQCDVVCVEAPEDDLADQRREPVHGLLVSLEAVETLDLREGRGVEKQDAERPFRREAGPDLPDPIAQPDALGSARLRLGGGSLVGYAHEIAHRSAPPIR